MIDPNVITIGLCTYHRQEVTDTLDSLAKIAIPDGKQIQIVIADNSVEANSKTLIEGYAAQSPLAIHYLHAPASNISIARNACLEWALDHSQYLIFLDDDEFVVENWLSAHLDTAQREQADVVIGPVLGIYPEQAPEWVKALDLQSVKEPIIAPSGKIETANSGNTLINLDFIRQHPLRFDLEYGRSGGEDSIFFRQLTMQGGTIAFSEQAEASEHVPLARTEYDWLYQRRFRCGQTHGKMLLLDKPSTFNRLKQIFLAGAKAGFSYVYALRFINQETSQKYFWKLRVALHLGVVSGLFGKQHLTQYGDTH
ncbi:glycosyltransferase family 2 protein [Photobacterium leiognathi]|uniref:glycosyltransferase family 2 protein n=1 Tax=Photobacterium leiognathi TaxID=553611 RepID=UPI002981F688|nr:glycosyltransferase family 2 protein [Photobacterium leiognathi]